MDLGDCSKIYGCKMFNIGSASTINTSAEEARKGDIMAYLRQIEPIKIGDKDYYTVKQFSHLTNRTTATIYNLLGKGNAIRKLLCIRVDGKPLIPVEELTDFPFAAPGPHGKDNPYFFEGA